MLKLVSQYIKFKLDQKKNIALSTCQYKRQNGKLYCYAIAYTEMQLRFIILSHEKQSCCNLQIVSIFFSFHFKKKEKEKEKHQD